jgi:hypothetical protein
MTWWQSRRAVLPAIALVVGVGIGGAVFLAADVSGQDKPSEKAKTAPAAKSAAPAKPAAPAAGPAAGAAPAVGVLTPPAATQVVMPDANKILLLLRTSLLTLNDAVRTGNYTVLLDTAAPGFREANPPARLAQVFAPLAQQGPDLSVVAVTGPQLVEAPVLDQSGRLRLKGFFPSNPVQIHFEVVYVPVDGRWRLLGLAVSSAQRPPVAHTGAVPAPAPRPAAKKP